MKLDDINDALDISLHSEDYDSIGGLIIEHLDRLPEAEETISTEDGITLQVKEISQNRIKKVSMTLPEETGESSSAEEETASAKKTGEDLALSAGQETDHPSDSPTEET